MHDRREPTSATYDTDRPGAFALGGPASFVRTFNPSELNLDDLAEAIRVLLTSGTSDGYAIRAAGDLLSSASRASHVLEALKAD